MNSIFNNFNKDIESYFVDFLDSISAEYKLGNKEIKLSWEKFKGSSESNAIIFQKEEPEPVVVIINEINGTNNCSYVFIKGKNSGSSCSNATKNDNKYCTKHIKFDTEDKKDKKKIIPKLVDNKKMVLMNLQDTPYWWNKDTGLIFISSEDKTVIAKYSDGQINKLSEDDIKNCDKDNLKYNVAFNLDIKPEKPKEDDTVVVNNNKKKLIKSPTDEDKKKLEIYKTNACAKNVEDVLANILKNDSDSDEDDFMDEEENEEGDEEEKEEIRSENDNEEEDLDLEEDDDLDEEEYLDEEM